MTADLSTALEAANPPKEAATVLDLLDRMRPEIERGLPKAMRDGDRFTRLVLTEIRRTPELLDCSPESLLGGMMLAAQLGLEPGPLGHVYLVPFKREVTFIVGYRGFIELAYRSGRVKEIVARTVYEGEPWEHYESETGAHFKHKPQPPSERGNARLWYARARTVTGGNIVQVCYPEDAEKARQSSPAGRKGVGPWVEHYDAMARKTAVRRLAPFLPQSPDYVRAAMADETPAPPVLDVPEGSDDGS
jgi:recombination protein RecT